MRSAERPSQPSPAGRQSGYRKVILLGIDGLDPRVLALLAADGAIANFTKLARAPLQTIAPAQSPVVWSTLATGANPGRHGIFDFIHCDPQTYRPFLSITQSKGALLSGTPRFLAPRKGQAFWNLLTDQGVPVSVLRWPVTFPPEQVNGRMLAGLGVPDVRGMLGGYTLYTDSPAAFPDVPAEAKVEVHPEGGRIQTVIRGPRVRGLTAESVATVPLTIRWEDAGGGVTAGAGGAEVSLRPGAWSEWVRLRFSTGPLKSAHCMVKLCLVEREPTFKLYVGNVELDPARPAFPLTSPSEYAEQLTGRIGPFHTLGMPEDTKAFNEHVLTPELFAAQCDEITDDRLKMFWDEFGLFREGVLAFVFDASDRVQHMFWKENELDGDGNVARVGPHIRQHYARMDGFVGRLLKEIGPDTALLVFSDHGFTSYDRSVDVNAWLVSEGLMTLTSDPAGHTEDEAALYRLVDWSRTQAYAFGFSSIRLNLKGREGQGTLDPSREQEVALRIAEGLAAFSDPETGRRPVNRVYRTQDIYAGPHRGEGPDLVVACERGYRVGNQTAVGGVSSRVVEPNIKQWSGDHIVAPSVVPAVIMANVPLQLEGATAYDVAPTAMSLLGLSMPECDGRPLPPRAASTA